MNRQCENKWANLDDDPDCATSCGIAAAFLLAAFVLLYLGGVRRTTWNSPSVERAEHFCHRAFARSLASSEN